MENQERQAQTPPTFMATREQQITKPGQYKQELARNIGIISAVGIMLSGIAPLTSIFLIAPVIFDAQGSGVFLSAVITAICLGIALCYTELGSAFPECSAFSIRSISRLRKPRCIFSSKTTERS
jgi:hypothetical protein